LTHTHNPIHTSGDSEGEVEAEEEKITNIFMTSTHTQRNEEKR